MKDFFVKKVIIKVLDAPIVYIRLDGESKQTLKAGAIEEIDTKEYMRLVVVVWLYLKLLNKLNALHLLIALRLLIDLLFMSVSIPVHESMERQRVVLSARCM